MQRYRKGRDRCVYPQTQGFTCPKLICTLFTLGSSTPLDY